MVRRNWAFGVLFAIALVGGVLLTRALAGLDATAEHTDDTLNCLLYEVTAHRLANQGDHDYAAQHHGYPIRSTDEHGRPNEIPDHLRAACEAILPGSTGDP